MPKRSFVVPGASPWVQDQEVALKRIRPELAGNPEYTEMLLEEALKLAREDLVFIRVVTPMPKKNGSIANFRDEVTPIRIDQFVTDAFLFAILEPFVGERPFPLDDVYFFRH